MISCLKASADAKSGAGAALNLETVCPRLILPQDLEIAYPVTTEDPRCDSTTICQSTPTCNLAAEYTRRRAAVKASVKMLLWPWFLVGLP